VEQTAAAGPNRTARPGSAHGPVRRGVWVASQTHLARLKPNLKPDLSFLFHDFLLLILLLMILLKVLGLAAKSHS
jgi:hypothetical protein